MRSASSAALLRGAREGEATLAMWKKIGTDGPVRARRAYAA